MSEAKRRFFSGDTLRQALVQAANYHDVDPDQIAYRSIEKRHGFIKTRRRVMIEVDPDHPKRPEGVPAPRPEAAPTAVPAAVVPVATAPVPRPSPPPARPAPAVPARPERERPAGGERRREQQAARPAPRPVALEEDEGLIALPERPLRTSERFPPATGPQAEAEIG